VKKWKPFRNAGVYKNNNSTTLIEHYRFWGGGKAKPHTLSAAASFRKY